MKNKADQLEQSLKLFNEDITKLEQTIRELADHYVAAGNAATLVLLAESNEDKRLLMRERDAIVDQLMEVAAEYEQQVRDELGDDPMTKYKESIED